MKTFELPISDCQCFVVGEIGPDVFSRIGKPLPKRGIIIWYEEKEAGVAACKAVAQAHYE